MRVAAASQPSLRDALRGRIGHGTSGSGQGRGNGGQWGQLAPTTWELWGRRPPPFDCQCRSFLFLFVFARLSQKIVGQIRGVFSFG